MFCLVPSRQESCSGGFKKNRQRGRYGGKTKLHKLTFRGGAVVHCISRPGNCCNRMGEASKDLAFRKRRLRFTFAIFEQEEHRAEKKSNVSRTQCLKRNQKRFMVSSPQVVKKGIKGASGEFKKEKTPLRVETSEVKN